MALVITVDEVKKNLGLTLPPGTYKLEELLIIKDNVSTRNRKKKVA